MKAKREYVGLKKSDTGHFHPRCSSVLVWWHQGKVCGSINGGLVPIGSQLVVKKRCDVCNECKAKERKAKADAV